MSPPSIFLMFMLVACLANLGSSNSSNKNYVRDACHVTRYPDICIRSLSPFSDEAKKSPSKWARAGVSVTLREVKSIAGYLLKLKRGKHMKGKNRGALLDCIELFQDAIDELHKSLHILRRLSATNFDAQMGDLTTWLSAALTDEDTCSDGFEGRRERQVSLLRNRVVNGTYITSNALALVTKLASTGLKSITD